MFYWLLNQTLSNDSTHPVTGQSGVNLPFCPHPLPCWIYEQTVGCSGGQSASPSTSNGVSVDQRGAAIGNAIAPMSACAVGVLIGMASLL
jgi:hypothetical protein